MTQKQKYNKPCLENSYRSQSGFAIPAGTFEDFNNLQSVSDGLQIPSRFGAVQYSHGISQAFKSGVSI
jgi:hypothetical protein